MQTDNRTQTPGAETIKNEIERDLANYTAAKLAAENNALAQQHEVAVDMAVNEAEQRTRAEQQAATAMAAATIEADQRLQAEQQAVSAHLSEQRAHQEVNRLATERSLLHESLASERESASNANFGFIFLTCIVLAALIGLGIWYYTNAQTSNAGTNGAATQTSSNSLPGQNTTAAAPRNQNPPPVIIRENPSLVVVPVPSTTNESKSVRLPSGSNETKAETQQAAPPPNASDTSESGSTSEGSTSDGTKPESTTNDSNR